MTSEPLHYVGVDWASGAWIAVVYSDENDAPEAEVFDTIRDVWSEYGESCRRVVVDVPIGLCESVDADECTCREEDGEIFRACDSLARRAVGDRYRSVFTPPARESARLAAADEVDYSEVTEKNKELTGKGLTRQAAGIARGIVEVEQLLLNGGDSDKLVEGHPEVCFRAFNGEVLEHGKKTAPGVHERLSAMTNVEEYCDQHWRHLAESLGTKGGTVGLDDLLDALVLALTAFADDAEYKSLPSQPLTDPKGLPMQMVYRSEHRLVDQV
ncbi:DUF429 family protein [Haloferax gibbonsii]|uniref:DUF429 family protein n=1 Tax=Haloferax gibbonsii TaxID=35746 RepID=A0A871BGU1_HALGI|nr:DUF429 domain-containing protein [Haloferax gibbonsii]QOS12006.1 DUF429 family protein [Haloferax gibbonsii]